MSSCSWSIVLRPISIVRFIYIAVSPFSQSSYITSLSYIKLYIDIPPLLNESFEYLSVNKSFDKSFVRSLGDYLYPTILYNTLRWKFFLYPKGILLYDLDNWFYIDEFDWFCSYISRACFLDRQIIYQIVFIPIVIVVLYSSIRLYSCTQGTTPSYNCNNI